MGLEWLNGLLQVVFTGSSVAPHIRWVFILTVALSGLVDCLQLSVELLVKTLVVLDAGFFAERP